MLLPHRLTLITPVGIADEYSNPVLRLDYGPGAARRTIAGLMQPTGSTPNPEPGRTAVVTTWRLFTNLIAVAVGPNNSCGWFSTHIWASPVLVGAHTVILGGNKLFGDGTWSSTAFNGTLFAMRVPA